MIQHSSGVGARDRGGMWWWWRREGGGEGVCGGGRRRGREREWGGGGERRGEKKGGDATTQAQRTTRRTTWEREETTHQENHGRPTDKPRSHSKQKSHSSANNCEKKKLDTSCEIKNSRTWLKNKTQKKRQLTKRSRPRGWHPRWGGPKDAKPLALTALEPQHNEANEETPDWTCTWQAEDTQ